MRVTELELKNFRCFEDESFVFPEPFTVLIGANGSGKSALLDALRIGIGLAFGPLVELRELGDEDVRLRRFTRDLVVHTEPQYPASVQTRGEIDERHFSTSWIQTDRLGVGLPAGGDVDDIIQAVRAGDDRTVPVVAVYGTQRTSSARGVQLAKRTRSRTDGYVQALAATSNAEAFTDWLRQRTGQRLEAGRSPDDLVAVLSALEHALPDWNGVRFDFTEDTLLAARVRDGEEIDQMPFRSLSDGQRALTGMMCDLAYRCAVLNPHLGREAARQTPGVVLIDELDLHLHPRWQRSVVDDLREAFPAIQFIATTHSPFIIQALPPCAVIDLSKPAVRAPGGPVNEPEATDYRKQSIEDIAEDTMGVENPQWSEKRKEWWFAAERYYALLAANGGVSEGSGEIAAAKHDLDLASIPFADDMGFAAMLALDSSQRGES